MLKPTKVLFVVPYPLRKAPSQRFRVEQFFPFLQEHNICYEVVPFLDSATFSVLYNSRSFLKKGGGVVKGFLNRFLLLFKLSKRDYVFIHREASPVGPPVFEFIVSKILRKKIIYDFDDAIWIPYSSNKLLNWIKAYWKVKWICRWSYKVVCGNEYLCKYAKKYNDNVLLIPTCVDVSNHHKYLKNQYETPVTIGWTGSHSTLKYLDPLVDILKGLTEKYPVKVLIISNHPPSFSFPGLKFIKWNEASEITDLMKMSVGIMPLVEDKWSEGKCGFKLIQYLSLGIPAVASSVGVNRQIIEEGHTGFFATNEKEWREALVTLIENAELREKMGRYGREKITVNYSIQTYKTLFLSLFE